MLTHPDPQIQALFNDITEQRDIAMVKAATLAVQVSALQAELDQVRALLTQPPAPADAVVAAPEPVPEPAPVAAES